MEATYSVGAFKVLKDPPRCSGFAGQIFVHKSPYRPDAFSNSLELANVILPKGYFEILALHENLNEAKTLQIENQLTRKYLQ